MKEQQNIKVANTKEEHFCSPTYLKEREKVKPHEEAVFTVSYLC